MFGIVPADSRKSNTAASAVVVSNNVTSTKAISTLQDWVAPGYTYNSVIGYVPLNFEGTLNTYTAPNYAFFNDLPNKYNSKRADPILPFDKTNLLRLPIGARICGAYLTNNGTEIIGISPGPVVTLDVAAIDFLNPETNPQQLFTSVGLADINGFGGINSGFNSPFGYSSILNPTGYTTIQSLPPLLTDSYSVGFSFSNEIISGSICIIVSYILPGNSFGKMIGSQG